MTIARSGGDIGGMPRKPTLRTVAAAAGVAVTTVSRALANDPKIAITTREHVAAVARRLGYVPDRAAQRLRTGRTKVISLILDPHPEILGFGNAMIIGLTEALADSGFHLVIAPNFAATDPLDPIRHIVRNRLADGIAFSRTQPMDPRARFLLEHGLPFVSHGRTELATPHCSVDFDNDAFGRLAAGRLADLGVRRICLVPPSPTLTFSHHLHGGIARVAAGRGIAFEVAEGVTIDSPADALSRWARELSDPPDGFIFPGEVSFFAVAAGLRERGLIHGRNYKAVVKSSSILLGQADPTVDQIHEDVMDAARIMGEILLQAINNPDQPPESRLLVPDSVRHGLAGP